MEESEYKWLVKIGALISCCIYSYRIVMLLVPYMWASMTFLPYMWASMTFWPKLALGCQPTRRQTVSTTYNNATCCRVRTLKCFLGLSVFLVQLLKECKVLGVSRFHFCQNLAPFDILRSSHHFFHVAANFVTLSYTKMAIFRNFPYPSVYCKLKKDSPFGRSTMYSQL